MIRSLMIAISILFFSVGMANAEDNWYYDHNGSTMIVEWGEGDSMTVKYLYPRDGIPVHRGTILFHGASPANGSIYGTAYIFSSKCGKTQYEVAGSFEGDNFRLRGAAPVLNAKCKVTRYEWNHNSQLYFTDLN